LFELSDAGARRVRLFVGHADEVTSVGVSSDQRTLVSASRDQTICAYSLADWPNQRELGVRFLARGAKTVVDEVAAGSPGWEAGLTKGDELILFAFNGQQGVGGPEAVRARLTQPVPGQEFFFRVRRAGVAEPIDMVTTVRQRPLWRFFATHDAEWVLWRWRDFYYDTSTRGDSYIGWQISGDVGDTPEFHEAEKFRGMFHRPDKVADLIAQSRFEPDRVAIPDLLPPKITLEVLPKGSDGEVTVQLRAVPREGSVFASTVKEVALWVNDYRFKRWTEVGEGFRTQVAIPRSKLRSGPNRIIAQAYNEAGIRGESGTVSITTAQGPSPRRKLHALCVGISDYSNAARGPARQSLWQNLFYAADDARAIAEAWSRQGKNDLFADAQVRLLLEGAATRLAILTELGRLSSEVEPDDLVVLFMAGHGYAKKVRGNVFLPRSFAFACPAFDVEKSASTGIPSGDLYAALCSLPCQKLVLLDCCHSGSTNILRELSPDGIGPVMITACDAHQSSYDIPFLGHGAFTGSVLEALSNRFASADEDQDRLLNATELYGYAAKRVPETVALARSVLGDNAVQHPQPYIPRFGSSFPLAVQAAKTDK
jgi:hypothetical protein